MNVTPPFRTTSFGSRILYYAQLALGSVVWGSALIFGTYILLFYAWAYVSGNTSQWNEVLPGLYDSESRGSTIGIAIHFLAGGIILILGCLQLVDRVRVKYPRVHRIVGRVYVMAALAAALGGLVFIALKGTIGGTVMNAAFTGYGLLMGLAAIQTVRYARAADFVRHRAWAIRLFALAIGSWLYRMGYGFYIGFSDQTGHTADFTGWFDYFMDFAFYLPNLAIAQLFIIRRSWYRQKTGLQLVAASFLFLLCLLLLFATYFFVRELWGPGIMSAFE
ncbi:hypothetical protein CEQ90_18055 [Lewinellaceae bacterium SD302]|nr:hypothetical protein CEQ90_18055 [Lewinellaceae bacterium SD302]